MQGSTIYNSSIVHITPKKTSYILHNTNVLQSYYCLKLGFQVEYTNSGIQILKLVTVNNKQYQLPRAFFVKVEFPGIFLPS